MFYFFIIPCKVNKKDWDELLIRFLILFTSQYFHLYRWHKKPVCLPENHHRTIDLVTRAGWCAYSAMWFANYIPSQKLIGSKFCQYWHRPLQTLAAGAANVISVSCHYDTYVLSPWHQPTSSLRTGTSLPRDGILCLAFLTGNRKNEARSGHWQSVYCL